MDSLQSLRDRMPIPGRLPQDDRPNDLLRVGRQKALLSDLLAANGPKLWKQLPALIRRSFHDLGYAWVGIYGRVSETCLALVSADGPPVCGQLERAAGSPVGSSGMCWDGILTNRFLAAPDVKAWPGYVSCDGESGLKTVAGWVCPIRHRHGPPLAVLDVDLVQPLHPDDPPFFDRLVATLALTCPADFETELASWKP